LLDAEVTAENQRKLLNNTYGFSTYEMFEFIKSRFNSYISKPDVTKINQASFIYARKWLLFRPI
jgi:hypothetical protein